MNRPLKHAVSDYFEQRSLSGKQLERIESLLGNTAAVQPGQRNRISLFAGWAAAATVAVLLAVLLLQLHEQHESQSITQQIALEVARNHIKLKPLDVETDTMEGIRSYFSDLEFVPVESALLAQADLELLGGRYCSVQSIPAAQLRVTPGGSGALQTLYQTEDRREVFGPLPILEDGDSPVTVNVKGITVRIWVEKGLLFALTGDAGLEPVITPD